MPARADVVVQIDKSSQRMAVSVDGMMLYNGRFRPAAAAMAHRAACTIRNVAG